MKKIEKITNHSKLIEVAVVLPVENTFTYAVPDVLFSQICVGKRVFVPFGKPSTTFGQRSVTGYILGPGKLPEQAEVKCILDILDKAPLFPPSMLPFFKWISDYYIYPLGQVIHNALPGGLNIRDLASARITDNGKKALAADTLPPLKYELLTALQQGGHLPLNTIHKKINKKVPISLIHNMEQCGWIQTERTRKGGTAKFRMEKYICLKKPVVSDDKLSKSGKKILDIAGTHTEISLKALRKQVRADARVMAALETAGYISVIEKQVYRDPFGEAISLDSPPKLTSEQTQVVSEILNAFENGFATYLLAGVTGSGKTEVYMHLSAEVIRRGYNVLVLVPEIALISQAEQRFRARFGECVAVLHSGLSAGERYDQWMRICQDQAAIVIGARSAIFAPLEHIGMIIVDEEHDPSYKQENDLLYNARDLAVVRAKFSNCIVVLGSATPSVQSCYNVETRKSLEVNLTTRVEERPLPDIQIVDLRTQRDAKGFQRFITPTLHQAIRETLGRKEQVLIFLNRRGFSNFPVCAACGEPVGCKHCDITLTLHQAANAYKCHYCGFTRPASSGCMICGSSDVKLLGFGTEKVEQIMTSLFPDARVARMDRDTTARKGSVLKILKSLKHREIDILVGTQMVTKGHDFPDITLVGIICADMSLSFPDFRSGERTFQLLAQVAGRAGRGDAPGKVILQTYNPKHFSIIAAKEQDFRAFYDKDIVFRKALRYPPISRLIQLRISGKNREKTRFVASELGMMCKAFQKSHTSFSKSLEILGPAEAPVARIAEHYRWQILIKSLNVKLLHRFVRGIMRDHPLLFHHQQVRVVVDVDPFFMC